MSESTVKVFFELVKAGLFSHTEITENTEKISWEGVDWGEVYRLAEEQSVIGLVSAGLDWFKVNDSRFTVPQAVALQFIGQTLQIEQRNKAMNAFVAELVTKLRKADIYAILVKGQGVAQCYEKPLWRACGDVDLFLSDENYQKAKDLLLPLGEVTEPEERAKKHFAMSIDGFAVELHGTLHSGLSARVDRGLDEIKKAVFYDGRVRSWLDGNVQVFLPKADEDAVYVFNHFLQHFYKGGIGLRQICDWCRLLWTYRDEIDVRLLEQRIKRMGLISEWKAFYALASKYLGMPDLDSGLTDVESATPRHSSSKLDSAHGSIADFMVNDSRFDKKAERIMEFILEVGNFGHNRDMSYYGRYPYVVRKAISAWWRVKDLCRHARIFPLDSLRFSAAIMFNGVRSTIRGE